jgi:hypothetical protein
LLQVAAMIVSITSILPAQEFRGALLGRVSDPSGAAIPGAVIQITNEQTNVTIQTRTNVEGNYNVLFLLPGPYRLTVEAAGFRRSIEAGIVVQVNDRIVRDAALALAAVGESVTVTSENPQLQAASADLGQVVENIVIRRIPIGGRNPLNLVDLAPGVLAGSGGYTNNSQTAISINGGTVSISTRSGTNQFHGTFADYYQNRALNANSWTNNSLGFPKLATHKNVWGGTLGGPMRLPGYDGRNRTFFYFHYEQTTDMTPDTRFGRVPTDPERTGDFSRTPAPNGQPVAIYDPHSSVVTGATGRRTPFPGARIGQLNWADPSSYRVATENLGLRADQALGSRQRLYGRFSMTDHDQSHKTMFPGNYDVPLSASSRGTVSMGVNPRYHKSFAVDDSITFTPTSFGSFRYGYLRAFMPDYFDGTGRDPRELKLPDIIVNNQGYKGWPIMALGESIPYVGSTYRKTAQDAHALLATMNQLLGRHTLKYGADFRLSRWNEANLGANQAGNFTYNAVFTSSNPDSTASRNSSGTSMASLLLGVPASGNLGNISPMSLQSYYAGLFVQDDIKVNRKLTLNIGLRFEVETPHTERYNRLGYGFDEYARIPVEAPCMELRGGLLFIGAGGNHRRQGTVDTNNFGPRFGAAWSATPSTVLRGGYGMFFSSGVLNQTTAGSVASFDAITRYVASIDGWTPANSIAAPFPNGLSTPTGSSLGLATELGNAITFISPGRRLPYVRQWQVCAQRQLPWQTIAEAAYVGTHSVGLLSEFNWNERPDQYLALGVAERDPVRNPFLGVFPATSRLGQGATLPQSRFWVRFPQFDTVTAAGFNADRALYHALQMRAQKRFSSGLMFVATYAYSKTMESETTSMVNERHYRTVSDIDRTHMFRAFATYELPAGKGKAFGNAMPRWLDGLLGGWEVGGAVRLTSGTPLTITDRRGRPIPVRNPTFHASVKERLGDIKDPVTGTVLNPYFDTGAFVSLPSDYSITPEPPRYGWLRGPRGRAVQLTLAKVFPIRERVRLEVRAEAGNPTNSPVFGNPNTDMSNPANFGVITNGAQPRGIQMVGRVIS